MQFDGMTMRACLDDLRAEASGARLQRIAQISHLSLSLQFWAGRPVELVVSAHSEAACLFVVREAVLRNQQPSHFCSALRRILAGKRLDAVSQPGWDRTAILRFVGRDELGLPTAADLVIETMGRHSNIICVRADGRIVDSAKRVGRSRSRVRQILPGLVYSPPPAQDKHGPDEMTRERVKALVPSAGDQGDGLPECGFHALQRSLLSRIAGLGPHRAKEIARMAWEPGGRSVDELAARVHDALSRLIGRSSDDAAAEIQAVEETYVSFLAREQEQPHSGGGTTRGSIDQTAVLLAAVRASLAHSARRLKATSAQLAEVGDPDEPRLQANAILGSLSAARASVAAARRAGEASVSITVPLYDAGSDASGAPASQLVELDTGRDPVHSAQELYTEYTTRKNRRATLETLVAEEQAANRQLKSLEFQLNEGPGPQEFEEIRAEAIAAGIAVPAAAARRPAKAAAGGEAPAGPRRYISPGGLTILVGRNNRQNESLIRQGDSDDLWLHARGVAGAHVLLRAAGSQPNEEDILYAAAVAARHSQAQASGRVAVDVCALRRVRKPRGGPPGYVNYSGERTVSVTPLGDSEEALGPSSEPSPGS